MLNSDMTKDRIYPSMVIRSQSEAIELLEKENKALQQKYDKALQILCEYSVPCEIESFMDKNTDYCSKNCSFDEEIFKRCWSLYIEQELENEPRT